MDPAHVDNKESPHHDISSHRNTSKNKTDPALLDPMAPPSCEAATVRVLCPKLLLSGNQPGALQWLIGSPFFPPFTVVSTFRCIHQSPDLDQESGKKKPFPTRVLQLAHIESNSIAWFLFLISKDQYFLMDHRCLRSVLVLLSLMWVLVFTCFCVY